MLSKSSSRKLTKGTSFEEGRLRESLTERKLNAQDFRIVITDAETLNQDVQKEKQLTSTVEETNRNQEGAALPVEDARAEKTSGVDKHVENESRGKHNVISVENVRELDSQALNN